MTHKRVYRLNECILKLSDITDRYAPPFEGSLDSKWVWYGEWNPSTTEHPAECECAGWQCSECKELLEDIVGGYWDDIDNPPIKVKYCPNCGANMFEGASK